MEMGVTRAMRVRRSVVGRWDESRKASACSSQSILCVRGGRWWSGSPSRSVGGVGVALRGLHAWSYVVTRREFDGGGPAAAGGTARGAMQRAATAIRHEHAPPCISPLQHPRPCPFPPLPVPFASSAAGVVACADAAGARCVTRKGRGPRRDRKRSAVRRAHGRSIQFDSLLFASLRTARCLCVRRAVGVAALEMFATVDRLGG